MAHGEIRERQPIDAWYARRAAILDELLLPAPQFDVNEVGANEPFTYNDLLAINKAMSKTSDEVDALRYAVEWQPTRQPIGKPSLIRRIINSIRGKK